VRVTQPVADPQAPLARRNPLAKLAAAFVLSFPLLATLDPLTPSIYLAVELAVVPFTGVRWRALARVMWPLWLAAAGVLFAQLVFAAERTGRVVASLGPFEIHSDPLTAGIGLAIRIFAVALPNLLAFATTDPTDLADALVRYLKVPARFAIGALAALRLLPLLVAEWDSLGMARRARGIDAGFNPIARLKLFGSTLFALLVGAIRRGTRLATAMEARGFDSGTPRTMARSQHFGLADWVLILAAVALAAGGLALSVTLGLFRPVIS